MKLALAALVLLASTTAHALESVSASDLSGMTNEAVTSLVQTIAIAGDHRAYAPATPLGYLLGVDLGIEATYMSMPSAFTTALTVSSGQSSASLPPGLLLPKLNIHKGLPFGFDLGFSFLKLGDVFSSYGGEIKWAFVRKPVIPTIAARVSYSANTLYYLKAHSFTFDVVASKSLFIIDPYAGMGMRFWGGSIVVPLDVPGLPSSVSADASGSNFHLYAGLQLKLLILKLVAQAEYSTAGITLYGGKVSLGF